MTNRIRVACNECISEFIIDSEMDAKYHITHCVFCGSEEIEHEELDLSE